jgi:hypothetical protein
LFLAGDVARFASRISTATCAGATAGRSPAIQRRRGPRVELTLAGGEVIELVGIAMNAVPACRSKLTRPAARRSCSHAARRSPLPRRHAAVHRAAAVESRAAHRRDQVQAQAMVFAAGNGRGRS